MSVMLVLIVVAVALLAYMNGANDNFKGVATLFGSGKDYRKALVWATVTTLAGSLLALVLAHGLVDTFKGKGLVPDAVTADPAFLLAVSLGAALTVLIATYTGMPVSTTHALTGGLVGAGFLAADGDVKLSALGSLFVVPLLGAPLMALVLTLLVYPLFRWVRSLAGVQSRHGSRIENGWEAVTTLPDGTLALMRTGEPLPELQVSQCYERYHGQVMGVEAAPVLDSLHYLSAGAVGFARGLNDAPKIVALMIAAGALDAYLGRDVATNLGLGMVALVMALGGAISARRVAETMSKKITRMNPGQGFTANLVTAFLVTCASKFGLPVSTTHVSVGSLFGIGLVNGTARTRTILIILLAWVTTLPVGALLAAGIYLLTRTLG